MEVNTPNAPVILPAAEQAKWKARYAEGYKQGLINTNGNEAEAGIQATKYANQMLRVPEITSFAQAKSLPAWMVVKMDEATGKVVTADGKKYEFGPWDEEPKAEPEKPIEKMSKDELIAFAKANDITIPDGVTKKDDIFAVVAEAQKAKS